MALYKFLFPFSHKSLKYGLRLCYETPGSKLENSRLCLCIMAMFLPSRHSLNTLHTLTWQLALPRFLPFMKVIGKILAVMRILNSFDFTQAKPIINDCIYTWSDLHRCMGCIELFMAYSCYVSF